jgi:hypothetical protein
MKGMNMKFDPRMIFGFLLLFMLTALGLTLGLGHVSQESSYGLEIILGSISTLSGAFGQWCFSRQSANPEEQKQIMSFQKTNP